MRLTEDQYFEVERQKGRHEALEEVRALLQVMLAEPTLRAGGRYLIEHIISEVPEK